LSWFKPKPLWEPRYKVGEAVYYLVGGMRKDVWPGNISAVHRDGFYVVKLGSELQLIHEENLIHAT